MAHGKFINHIFLMIFSLMVASCADRSMGYGTITEINPVKNNDNTTKTAVRKDAAKGAKIGAATGVTTGALVGTGFGVATLGLGFILMPAFLAVGAAAGAATGAGTGAAIGAGTPLYKLSVKMDEKSEVLSIMQYLKEPLRLKTRVQVFLADDKLYLKKAEETKKA